MLATDLELLASAARESGEIARSFWRSDPQVWDKGDDDPVSEADLAVNQHLKTTLLGARPDYGWVSEESEDDASRLDAERVFVVDPIDGTRSFVAGERTWAHSLAVVERGRVTSACVFLPARDKLYLARRGGGASLNGVRICATAPRQIDGATVLGPRASFQSDLWTNGPPPVERHFRPSLAYRLSLVAEGRFDAMLTLRPAWEWDIAAGALIASEAGARVTDRKGNELGFNSISRRTEGVVVAGDYLHGALLAALA